MHRSVEFLSGGADRVDWSSAEIERSKAVNVYQARGEEERGGETSVPAEV